MLACEVEDADIIRKEGIDKDEGDYYSVGADEDEDDAVGAIMGAIIDGRMLVYIVELRHSSICICLSGGARQYKLTVWMSVIPAL